MNRITMNIYVNNAKNEEKFQFLRVKKQVAKITTKIFVSFVMNSVPQNFSVTQTRLNENN